MGYFSHYKRDPKTRFAAKYQRFFSLFLKIFVQFQAFKNLYNPKKQENMRKYEKLWEKKSSGFGKKKFRHRYRNWTLVLCLQNQNLKYCRSYEKTKQKRIGWWVFSFSWLHLADDWAMFLKLFLIHPAIF